MLSEVRQGAAVTITSGGRPIARLVPIADEATVLDRLVQMGRATAPTNAGPLAMPPTHGDETTDVAEALANDRDAERW